jgi:hypothetical protein
VGRLLSIALLVACLAACGAESATTDPSPSADVAAVIDGKPMLRSDVQDQVQRLSGDITTLPPDKRTELSRQVLDRMIDDRLCAKALAQDGVPITDAEVDAELARRPAQPADGNLPTAVVREALRNMMCRTRLVERRGHFEAVAAGSGSDQALARQDAVARGQRWRDEEQRIFRDLRAHATIRIVTR